MADVPVFSAVLTDPAGRRENEDAVYTCEHIEAAKLSQRGRLYIVADGTGGQAGGGTASTHAITVASDTFYEGASGAGDVGEDLRAAIQAGHRSLHRLAQDAPSWKDMSTTIVAAVVHGDQLYIAHVGDSRAYLVHDRKVRQITRDHVWEEDDDQFGSLTRWLGGADHPTVEADLTKLRLQEGDVIILATDGLTGHVDEDEVLPVVSTRPVGEAARMMIELAKYHGTKDNASVALVRYGGAKIEGAPVRRRMLWLGAGVAAAVVLLTLAVLIARTSGDKSPTGTPGGGVLMGITVSPEQAVTQPAVPSIPTKTVVPLGPTTTRQPATLPNTPAPPAAGGGVIGQATAAPGVGAAPQQCPGNQIWTGKECTCPPKTEWIPQDQWCAEKEKDDDETPPNR